MSIIPQRPTSLDVSSNLTDEIQNLYKEGKIIYDGSPEIMEKYAITASKAGAKVIGGCCGTTPNHIKRMHAVLEKIKIDMINRPAILKRYL